MRSGESCTNCCGQGIAQTTMSTRNDDRAPRTPGTELGCCERGHRARVGNDHAIVGSMLPESINHALRCKWNIATGNSFGHLHPERRCTLCQYLYSPLTL